MKYIYSPTPVWLKGGFVSPVGLKAALVIFSVIAGMVLYFVAVANYIGPMPIY